MNAESPRARVAVQLSGVPETALWTLYHRAVAAQHRYCGLDDPLAVELADRLDYPFDRFRWPFLTTAARLHAARVRTFDQAVQRLLRDAPDATVVALGEGLETQFWRVDNARVRWLSVDLAEVIALRRQVLPNCPRNIPVAASATDPAWIRSVNSGAPVIVTAQGLLMYFDRDQVHGLVGVIAEQLPGARLVFDAVTDDLQRSLNRQPNGRAATGFVPPAWTWTVNDAELQQLAALPGVDELMPVPAVVPSGLLGLVVRIVPAHRRRWLPVFPVYQATLGTDVPPPS
jgi:O-methyltransferase involved in polyketide biosynthesis